MDKRKNKAEIIAGSILSLLKKNKEEYLLDEIIKKLSTASLNEKVRVYSPKVLAKEEAARVQELAGKLSSNKKISVEFVVDRTLIDGLRIEYKDKLWDLSLSKQINSLFEKENY